jgi:ABC-2 type transport system permease protein
MPILDQGYQHWSGTLSGHAWRWLAITRHGLRIALANRWLRIVLLVSWIPALALAAMLCLWGLLEQQSALIETVAPLLGFLDRTMLLDPRAHRMEVWTLSYNFFLQTELRFSMVLILIAGPNLISQDLRYNALPLYFSRPLRRSDYFLGKLGVIVGLLSLVTVVPAVIAYVLGLLFSLDLSIIRDTFGLLLASVAYGLIIAVSAGLLVLALSSLSRNSRYIALFWLAIWIGSSAVAGVLQGIDAQQHMRRAWREPSQSRREELFAEALTAARTNWRPMVSYTTNLSRIGQELLGTNEAWDKLSQLQPAQMRSMYLIQRAGPQYPWQWSAGTLAALMGLSAWLLSRSIKSLDRLK